MSNDIAVAVVKIIALLLLTGLLVVLSILIMIYGWGLAPVSWPWIIGGWFAALTAQLMVSAIKL